MQNKQFKIKVVPKSEENNSTGMLAVRLRYLLGILKTKSL
jgi:hypothetical protein